MSREGGGDTFCDVSHDEQKLDRRGFLYDAAIALGAGAIALSVYFSIQPSISSRPHVAGALLAVAHNLSLTFRRVRPLHVVGVQLATGLAVALLSLPVEILGIGMLIGTYSLGARRPARVSLPGLAVVEVVALASQWISGHDPDVSTQVGNGIMLAAAWFLGNSVFSRNRYASELELRNIELRKARDELARTAVSEERLRIARELHDIVAHSLSMIAVQSGVGAHVIDSKPEEAKRSLQVIEEASKSSLRDVRRVLGVLRASDGSTALDPAPRLRNIGAMVERFRAVGPQVDLQVYGDISTLSAGPDLTAYRVVQEALTNVLKHSKSKRARVVINRSPTELRVEVVDDGVGGSPSSGGHGLIGMRERVEMFGGQLEAGSLPEGGFRVDAWLPAEPTQ
jgi:signal transduction histidine kinase